MSQQTTRAPQVRRNWPALTLRSGFKEFRPTGKMIERTSVGVIELKRCNGNGAIANGGHVRVGLDALHKFLLMQPKITAAAWIGARLKDVARDLRGLLGETHFDGPRIWDIHVQ